MCLNDPQGAGGFGPDPVTVVPEGSYQKDHRLGVGGFRQDPCGPVALPRFLGVLQNSQQGGHSHLAEPFQDVRRRLFQSLGIFSQHLHQRLNGPRIAYFSQGTTGDVFDLLVFSGVVENADEGKHGLGMTDAPQFFRRRGPFRPGGTFLEGFEMSLHNPQIVIDL